MTLPFSTHFHAYTFLPPSLSLHDNPASAYHLILPRFPRICFIATNHIILCAVLFLALLKHYHPSCSPDCPASLSPSTTTPALASYIMHCFPSHPVNPSFIPCPIKPFPQFLSPCLTCLCFPHPSCAPCRDLPFPAVSRRAVSLPAAVTEGFRKMN